MQLRQQQIEQRKEKQQAKASSMDNMAGGTKATAGEKSTGQSQESMTAMISADSSMKQAKVQGSVATSMEGRAGVLESEIKNNHGSDVTKKIEELADVTQKAQAATVSQMSILAEVASGKETSETVDSQKNSKVENGKMKSGTAAYAKELAKHAPRKRQ